MNNNEIYDFSFYKKNLWIEEYDELSFIIKKILNPKSIIDIGCGSGMILKNFKEIDCLGIDGSKYAVDFCKENWNICIENFDLRNRININYKYDLCISIEVAEHIEEKYSNIFVENLCSCSDKVLFTAATIGQNGINHVNEQNKEYWMNIFKKNNYYINEKITHEFKKELNCSKKVKRLWWIEKNISFYQRVNNE